MLSPAHRCLPSPFRKWSSPLDLTEHPEGRFPVTVLFCPFSEPFQLLFCHLPGKFWGYPFSVSHYFCHMSKIQPGNLSAMFPRILAKVFGGFKTSHIDTSSLIQLFFTHLARYPKGLIKCTDAPTVSSLGLLCCALFLFL